MAMKIFSLLVLLVFIVFLGIAEAEYNLDLQDTTIRHNQDDHRHWSSADKMNTPKFSNSKDDEWLRPEKHRRHFGPIPRYRKSFPIIIYRENAKEPTLPVEERTKITPRNYRAPRPLSPQRCSGDTVYSKNKRTGELTIRYISPAEKC